MPFKLKPSHFGVLYQMVAILLISCLLGGFVNLIHPNRIPWIQDWDSYVETQARDAGIPVISWSYAYDQFKDGNVQFVDARPADEFQAGHIPNAVSLPFEQLDNSFDVLVDLVDSTRPVIIYCLNRDCDDGLLLAREFQALEKTNLFYFVDGFEAWKEAECPVAFP